MIGSLTFAATMAGLVSLAVLCLLVIFVEPVVWWWQDRRRRRHASRRKGTLA